MNETRDDRNEEMQAVDQGRRLLLGGLVAAGGCRRQWSGCCGL